MSVSLSPAANQLALNMEPRLIAQIQEEVDALLGRTQNISVQATNVLGVIGVNTTVTEEQFAVMHQTVLHFFGGEREIIEILSNEPNFSVLIFAYWAIIQTLPKSAAADILLST